MVHIYFICQKFEQVRFEFVRTNLIANAQTTFGVDEITIADFEGKNF